VTKQTTAVGYVRVSWVGGRGGESFLSPELQREQIALAARRWTPSFPRVLRLRRHSLKDAASPRSRLRWIERILSGSAQCQAVPIQKGVQR
jgi:hypothetical protein